MDIMLLLFITAYQQIVQPNAVFMVLVARRSSAFAILDGQVLIATFKPALLIVSMDFAAMTQDYVSVILVFMVRKSISFYCLYCSVVIMV